MDDGSIAELRRLQLRAYAPDGDIQDDLGALRRLEELEELRRASALTSSDAAESSRPAEDSPALADETTSPGLSPSPLEAPAPPAGRSRGSLTRRSWALLWTASLVAVAAVVGGTALSVTPPAPLTPGVHYVATLAEDPDFAWPKFLGDPGGDTTGFRDYLGFTAVMVDGGLWGQSASSCLLVMTTKHLEADSDGFNGQIFTGCGAGAFPATVELVVAGDSPAALLARFPKGSALQFVLDESRIAVYSDAE